MCQTELKLFFLRMSWKTIAKAGFSLQSGLVATLLRIASLHYFCYTRWFRASSKCGKSKINRKVGKWPILSECALVQEIPNYRLFICRVETESVLFFSSWFIFLEQADLSNQRDFFFSVHSRYKNVQSNQSNTRDRKKTSNQELTFFLQSSSLFLRVSISNLLHKASMLQPTLFVIRGWKRNN